MEFSRPKRCTFPETKSVNCRAMLEKWKWKWKMGSCKMCLVSKWPIFHFHNLCPGTITIFLRKPNLQWFCAGQRVGGWCFSEIDALEGRGHHVFKVGLRISPFLAKAEDERAVAKDYMDAAEERQRMTSNGHGHIGLFRRHSFGENLLEYKKLSLSYTRCWPSSSTW